MLIHLVGIAGDDNFVGAEAERVLLLVRRGGEDDDVRSERMSKFYRHVAQSRGTDLGDTTDDLMTGDNRVIRGHELAPLVADRMEIGVADAAEQDFNLHVAFSWIATYDLR